MIDELKLKQGLRKGLRIAAETANVAVQLRNDSGPLGLLSIGVKIANGLLGESVPTPIEGWLPIGHDSGLMRAVYEEAKRVGLLERRPGTAPGNDFWLGTIDGVRFGWQIGSDWWDGPYVEPGVSVEQAAAVLRGFIWANIGTSLVYGRQSPYTPATLEAEEAKTLPSALAAMIWDRQSAFLTAGYHCSVLLHGEHGTGKTYAARYIADQAGGLRLRIRARELEDLGSVDRVVRYLQPSAVIVDDLCRAKNKEGVLEVFNSLVQAVPLVIVTVNFIDALDPAVYRRFNALDVYEITQLDAAVLDQLLAGVPEEAADQLRTLPVKYINDYRREAEVFGHAHALKTVKLLTTRRDEVRNLSASYVAPRAVELVRRAKPGR